MPTVNYISVIPDGQDEDYQHPTFAEDFEIPPTPAFNEGDKNMITNHVQHIKSGVRIDGHFICHSIYTLKQYHQKVS